MLLLVVDSPRASLTNLSLLARLSLCPELGLHQDVYWCLILVGLGLLLLLLLLVVL
jgi:hypothetical protein